MPCRFHEIDFVISHIRCELIVGDHNLLPCDRGKITAQSDVVQTSRLCSVIRFDVDCQMTSTIESGRFKWIDHIAKWVNNESQGLVRFCLKKRKNRDGNYSRTECYNGFTAIGIRLFLWFVKLQPEPFIMMKTTTNISRNEMICYMESNIFRKFNRVSHIHKKIY